jgi:Ankyrin repeats (3 copies)/Ankyrin repeat
VTDGQSGPDRAPGSTATFAALRSRALRTEPESLGLSPGLGSAQVFGVIMDTSYAPGTATLIVLTDGTVSLCHSTGGGVLGAGDQERVAAAARRLLTAAESQLGRFAAGGGDDLPPPGETRITVRTYTGPLTLTAPESELGGGRHPVSPVFYAAYRVITELHKLGPGATAGKSGNGPTPLMTAAHHGDQRAVFILIGQGADLEAKDQAGYTALMYAANAGRDEVVRLLLAGGAGPNASDYQGSTPLMFAAQHDHLGIVRQLLSAHADPGARGIHGLTALDFARQNGHRRTITALTQASAT